MDALAHSARRVARDRTSNVVLIVGDVGSVAIGLEGMADEVRVHFPWGSLLRGVIGEDVALLDALGRLLRPDGSLTALLSVLPRDGVDGGVAPGDLVRIAARYEQRGFTIAEARALTKADVREATSSWGKRLDAGGKRPGLYLRALR